MQTHKYECWGADHEDLTAKVEAELARRARTSYVTFEENTKWKVFVKCSQLHENVFEGESTTIIDPIQP
jgi:hypothetical protein